MLEKGDLEDAVAIGAAIEGHKLQNGHRNWSHFACMFVVAPLPMGIEVSGEPSTTRIYRGVETNLQSLPQGDYFISSSLETRHAPLVNLNCLRL
jgi:hypothetical protein